MLNYEMTFGRPMMVLILPSEVDVSDADSVERAITAIDDDRIYLCGGSVRPKEIEGCNGK